MRIDNDEGEVDGEVDYDDDINDAVNKVNDDDEDARKKHCTVLKKLNETRSLFDRHLNKITKTIAQATYIAPKPSQTPIHLT